MENLIERLVIMADGDEIDANLLPSFLSVQGDGSERRTASFANRGDRTKGSPGGPGAQQMESDAHGKRTGYYTQADFVPDQEIRIG